MIGKHFFAEKKTDIFLFLLLLSGIFITCLIYNNENSKQQQALKHDFQSDSQLFSHVISNAVKSQLTFAKSIQSFFMASESVSSDEFEIFTKPYLSAGKGISAVIWAKTVQNKEKETFETQISTRLQKDFHIREFSAYGQIEKVPEKDIYYPLLYLVSDDDAYAKMLGYDLSILDCVSSCKFNADYTNGPNICVCSHIQKYFPLCKNYLLISPVPEKTKPLTKAQVDGVILVLVDIEKMLNELLSALPLENITFDIYEMKDFKKRLIFSNNQKSELAEFKDMSTTFKLADSDLYIQLHPNKNYPSQYINIKHIIIIPIGLIITLLLLLFIRSILAKETYAEKLVAKRTHDLEEALSLKNSIFNNNVAGLILTTDKYEIIDINDNACIIFEYFPEEIKSKNMSILYKSIDYFSDFTKNLHSSSSIIGAELELLRKDGSTAWCFVSVNSIVQDDKTLNIWVIHDITENRRIENKITEQEENIKIFFDAAVSLIFIIDKNLNILYSNNTAVERTNYNHTELRNMRITALYSPEYKCRAETEFYNIIDGKDNNCKFPIITKDCKTIYVDSKTAFGKWHGQDVVYIIYTDVSGKEEEHKKFEKAFQSNPTPMIITSIETGEFIEINDSFIRLFGYAKNDITGKFTTGVLYVNPEERQKILALIKQDGYLKNYHVEFRDKNGEKKDIFLNVEIINISDKKYFLSSLIDMTAINRTEQSLRESEERWKFALEGSGDGIWDWEVNSNNLFYSARAKALMGYENDELEGSYNDFLSRLHPDDKVHTLTSLQNYIDGKSDLYQSEHRLRCKSGSYLWVLVKGKTISYDEKGKPRRIIGTLTDISWHKQVENELRNARTEADSASQAKSRFLANMSHEIRTPLHGIIGLTELVLTTDLVENQRKYIENLKTSAYSLLDILNEVLDISKIESGKFKAAEVDFDIYSLAEKNITIFSAKCIEKDIQLIMDIRPEFPDLLTGDAVRIRQIISNLLSNAVKFTHHGEIVLSVRKSKVKTDEPNKIFVEFSVKDTGIGIPSDKIAYIFESFNQVDDSITRKYGGTGLGLTISKNLAEMMGGHLVHCKIQSFGYNRFNFIRASSVVNCQSTVVCRVLRSLFQECTI